VNAVYVEFFVRDHGVPQSRRGNFSHFTQYVQQPMRVWLEKTLHPTRNFAEKSDIFVSCYAYKENVFLQSSGLLYRVFWKLFTNISEEHIVPVPVNMDTVFYCEISVAIHHTIKPHNLEHENINLSWYENFISKIVVFWVVVSCSFVGGYRCFGTNYCLHRQGWNM
jgi:hypothetical protein